MTYRFIFCLLLIVRLRRGQRIPPQRDRTAVHPLISRNSFRIFRSLPISLMWRGISITTGTPRSNPGSFIPLGQHRDEDDAHGGLNARRGFNFNYGELTLYSVVDPYFDLFAVIHVAPEHAGLEEAYVTTRRLPFGFQIKAGKFLSSIGKLNEQHVHSWDFVDRPIISRAMFGDEGLNEIGTRITWVAPTDITLLFGAEILTGDHEPSFGATGFSDPNGAVHVDDNQHPGLLIGYVRTAFDIDDAAFLLGFSFARGTTKTEQGFSTGDADGSAIDATTDIVGGDLTIKYPIDPIRYISFQSEYLYRQSNGSYYTRDSMNTVATTGLDQRLSGFYAQLIAKLDLHWRAGLRYDVLFSNSVTVGATETAFPGKLDRYSAMVEYNPTEFSRLRLQYSYDRCQYLHSLIHKPFSEVILQLNVAIGAHGAHSF